MSFKGLADERVEVEHPLNKSVQQAKTQQRQLKQNWLAIGLVRWSSISKNS
jgi:hypothetical protein